MAPVAATQIAATQINDQRKIKMAMSSNHPTFCTFYSLWEHWQITYKVDFFKLTTILIFIYYLVPL